MEKILPLQKRLFKDLVKQARWRQRFKASAVSAEEHNLHELTFTYKHVHQVKTEVSYRKIK